MSVELVNAKELESQYQFAIEQQKKKLADKNAKTETFTLNVPDLAILKVKDGGDFPALTLGNGQTITEGSTIFAIGFPGLANSKELFSTEASKIATITKGTVSAVKPSANNLFKLVQIDATISPGNSGGPIVNNDGDVIAISTYGISGGVSDKDYNAGISVDELRKFLAEENINNVEGNISKTFEAAIDEMLQGYYEWAVRDFNKVKAAYPAATDEVEPLILLAQEKIDKGEDNSPVFTIGEYNIHKKELPIILGAAGVIGAVIVFIILMGILRGLFGKKKETPPTGGPSMTFPPVGPQYSAPQMPAAAPVAPAPAAYAPTLSPTGFASVMPPTTSQVQPTTDAQSSAMANSGFIAGGMTQVTAPANQVPQMPNPTPVMPQPVAPYTPTPVMETAQPPVTSLPPLTQTPVTEAMPVTQTLGETAPQSTPVQPVT